MVHNGSLMSDTMSQIVGIYAILFICIFIPITASYRWPDGDYVMPMSTYGCPDPDINEWKYGYMNISFWQGFELSVPSIGALGWSASNGSLKLFELLGPYGSHSIQLNFCGRVSGNGSISGNGSDQTLWPPGKYGIYGTEQNCPSGFVKIFINRTIPDVRHVNRDGFLPDIEIIQYGSKNATLLSVAVCQRVSDNIEGPMTTYEDHSFPFNLLALVDGENGTWNEPYITLRQLYILTINKQQGMTSFKWLAFYTINLIRDGDASTIAIVEEYGSAVDVHVGTGFCRRLYALTYPRDCRVMQVTRTYINAWMSLNFSQIPSLTTKLAAIEHLKNIVPPGFLCKFTDTETTKTDPYFIDEYMTNATVSYPSGAHYVQGNSFSGLIYPLQRQDAWVVYDAGTNVVISAVAFRGDFNGMSWFMGHSEVPTIYVSDMKWSFLSNGAQRCLSDLYISSSYYFKNGEYIEWIMVQCLNSPPGRYVSFVYHKQTLITIGINSFITAKFELLFISRKPSPRCTMSMGMRNLAIQDFQLSASTTLSGNPPSESRPHGVGWCGKFTERHSYLQIDFVSTVQVEGVQIFNWKRDFVMEPIEGYAETYSGVYSFRIEHGTNRSELNSLQQEFYLDPNLPGEHAQTLLFISPLITRFLLIYLVKHTVSIKCLRLEVIGCPAKDPYTRTCPTDSSKDWFPVRSLYIPAFQSNTALATVNTTSECLGSCKDTHCVSVIYNHGNRSCQMHSQTSTMGYRHVSVEGNRSEAFLGICHAGTHMVTWSQYFSSFVKLLWEDKTEFNPGVLTSYGYPLYYPSGAASIWTIKVAETQFLHLLFSNISLTKYQSSPGYLDTCQDTILLYSSDISTNSRVWPFIQYLESGRLHYVYTDQIRQTLQLHERDTQQFSLRLDRSFVHIIFKTADETCAKTKQTGNGFRMIAYASDFPTCIRWGYIADYNNLICPWKSAYIMSTSFLGTFWEERDYNMWELKGDYPEYIELEILDFDVGCDTGTIFELRNNGYISRHCNKNKPLYSIRSTLTSLTVKFQIKLCGSHALVEGFKGIYNVLTKNKDISNLAMTMDEEYSLSSKLKVKTVCAEEFNKCYVLLDLVALQSKNESMFVNVSWNMLHHMICPYYNWTMVNIHSQREQDFVGYFLHHELQNGSRRYMYNTSDKFDYTYIGLRRSNNKHYWSDGSPLTFTSWASGHPLQNVNTDCTRADLSSLSASITWESISCYQVEADFGVCEYYIAPVNQSRDDSLSALDETTPLESSFNSTLLDMSLYFECGSGEIISIIGICDGVIDCISGRDEEHCHNSSSCTTEQYSCYGGKCVDISVLCDHSQDCPYGDDEECYFPYCGMAMFQCESHQCIDMHLRCDGKPDCPLGEDEKSCYICNSDTSFSCGDYTCIPLAYRCDGIPDCRSEDDEKNCIKPSTCQEWWNAGYRENGMFEIHGGTLECNFDEIHATGKVITKYHDIDFLNDKGKRGSGAIYLQYGSLAVIDILHKKYSCYQSVDQLCQPWVQELYEIDTNGTGGANSYCQCLRYVKWFNGSKGYYQCDSGGAVNRKSSFWVSHSFKPYIEKLTLNVPSSLQEHQDTDDIRIRFNPVACYAYFFPPPSDIVCGNGITVAQGTRCLYDVSEHGSLQGCRNLMHLQECGSFPCPDGYYKCPGSFCLKEIFVCDGEKHCKHGEDEINCGAPHQDCRSKYRCLQSNICLSLDYLCDGYRQCPLGDDERFCHFRCPYGCVCSGMTADCRLAGTNNETNVSFNTKLIDLSTNHEFFLFLNQSITKLYYLSYLNMSSCGIKDISAAFFIHMHNLLSVDMTNNKIEKINTGMFIGQHRLQTLLLSGNTYIHIIETRAFVGLLSIQYLEMRHVHVGYMKKNVFDKVNMTTMDFSYNVIDSIDNKAFAGLSVVNMYFNETNIRKFDKGMFSGVTISNSLVTNNHKFCCIRPSELPEDSCYPLQDEFSSCSDLMRNDVLRSLLWIIGLFSLLGNAASLIYRFIFDRERLKLGYGVFVTNLAISDFLMGVYLITIASADVIFRGRYVFNDETWRGSPWCQMAGVLSTVSSEASVLFICLITLDRLLVIKYPFGQVRFSTFSSIVASIIVWAVVFIIAVIPLVITTYFKNNFYSKSGVCLALPLTRDRPPGWIYSISIFIGFNFVTFLAIAFGQWLIYTTINAAKARVKSCSTGRANDLRVARNLLLVASTDFLCWFPIGILGILALTNHVIPGVVYAWTAVLVLPINSALNPFLYTLTAILGRKKFVPDSNEQTRTETSNIEPIENHLDVWKSKLFVPRHFTDYLLPISHYMDRKGGFKLQKSLYAVGKIAKCLDFLHTRDMSPLNFTLDNIYVKQNGKRSFSIVLALHPRVLRTEEIRREDIKRFGQLVAAVIKKHHSYSAKY